MRQNKQNILFLSSWSYREPLVHSYLLPNVRIIRKIIPSDCKIFVQTSEKEELKFDKSTAEEIRNALKDEGIEWLAMPYKRFGFGAIIGYVIQIFKLCLFVQKNEINVLHPFAPAAGTTALFLRFFTRKKLVIDSWEPHADSMVETGVWRRNSFAYKILKWSEKKQTQHADVFIAASRRMPQYAQENFGNFSGRVLFRPACVDTAVFKRNENFRKSIREKNGWENKVVCACVSKLGGLYLKEDVFRFFHAGKLVFGARFHALLLSEHNEEEVRKMASAAGLNAEFFTHTHAKFEEVPSWLSACDFAFNPQQPVPSKRYGTPVKDGEYWAMGLPIVILPDISDDSEIVKSENAGVILQSLSDDDMILAMKNTHRLLEENPHVHSHIREIAIKYRSYDIATKTYQDIYGA